MLKKMSLVDLIKYLINTLVEIVTVIVIVLCVICTAEVLLNLSAVI